MNGTSPTEATPLLQSTVATNELNLQLPGRVDVYSRFTFAEKQRILGIVAFSALLTFFASGSFVPTIVIVARDLNTTSAAVNYTVAAYMLTLAIGGLVWGVYSGYYGRRPIYLFAFPFYIIGSFGVAASRNLWQLAIMRAMQGFGTSCFATSGVATVSDVFRLEERGRALGVYWGATLLGPAIAPLVGGAISLYFSWRIMQLALGIGALIAYTLVVFFLPETSHPGSRGYDKDQLQRNGEKGKTFVILNPFKSLSLLQSPNLFSVALIASVSLSTDYFLLIPLSNVWGVYFGITNPLVIGACFLPSGFGNMVGSPIVGWLSDRIIIRGKRSRGYWIPEDRLKAMWPGMILMGPLSVLGYGIATQYMQREVAIVLNLFWLLVNGLAVINILGPCGVYGVDIFYTRSAEVVAALNFFRHIMVSAVAAVLLPMIESIGIAWTGAVFALVAWLTCILLWVTIRYGDTMRQWKDMGYTIKEN